MMGDNKYPKSAFPNPTLSEFLVGEPLEQATGGLITEEDFLAKRARLASRRPEGTEQGFINRNPAPQGGGPAPPVHTQNIENTWQKLKQSMKHLQSTSRDLMPTYLYQYMFRKAHDNKKIWNNLWFAISVQYPV